MKMMLEDLLDVLSGLDGPLGRGELSGGEHAKLHDDLVRAAGWSMTEFYGAIDQRWDYVMLLPARLPRLAN